MKDFRCDIANSGLTRELRGARELSRPILVPLESSRLCSRWTRDSASGSDHDQFIFKLPPFAAFHTVARVAAQLTGVKLTEYCDWLSKCHKVILDGTPLRDNEVEELLFLLDTYAPAVAWCQEHVGATFLPNSWPGSGHGFSWHNKGAEFYFAEAKDAMEFMFRWG